MENKTFTFEDIMLLDDLSLRRVMGRVESEHLENAFIGADAGIWKTFIMNYLRRGKRLLLSRELSKCQN